MKLQDIEREILVKLGILVNAEPVDALVMMVHKDFAQTARTSKCVRN